MKNPKIMLAGILLAVLGTAFYFNMSKHSDHQTAQKLYFYNWSEYITEEMLKEFTDETGIEVILTTYDSNEVMYSKLKMLKGTGYDLVVPSTYYVRKLWQENLIQPLDLSKISNFKHIDVNFLDKSYDPKNKYSVPYIWGATAIGVNKQFIDPASITSWKDLWKPEYKNKLLLMNDVREVFHVALKLNGHSVNSTNPKHIKQAYNRLKTLIPHVTVFNSDTPAIPFLSGEVEIGMIWNGSAYMAQKEDPNIQFIYPKEGPILWMDNLSIPKRAENVEAAYAMINFLLRPDIAARISDTIGYPTANKSAKVYMNKDMANNPIIYPPEEIIKTSEFQDDIGDAAKIYDKYWQMLKTQQ
tara:strand:+ start:3666 stop:4733 length:1068 start_codon:yes stop_codon:yes gene_type:complete